MAERILFVTKNYFEPENHDGVNKILYNLFNVDENLTLGLLCLSETPRQIKRAFLKHKLFFLNQPEEERSLLEKVFRFLSSRPQSLMPRKKVLELARKVESVHRSFDQIVVVGSSLIQLIDYLDEQVAQKTSLLAIDSLSLFFETREMAEPSSLKRKLFRMERNKALSLEETYYPRYRRVVFVSQKDLDHVVARGVDPGKGGVVANGINPKVFFPIEHRLKHENQLVFTGNLDYAPNYQACEFLVYQLMPALLKSHPKLQLKIVGRNASEKLQQVCGDNVEFVGYVEDLNLLLNGSAVYLAPIFHGAGIKNKVLEALAVGLPVVGTPLAFDGMEAFDLSGTVVVDDLYSLERWTKAIDKALSLSLIETEFTYTWEKVLKNYKEIF